MRSSVSILAVMILAAGCAIRVPPPRNVSIPAPDPPDRAWASVLSRFVDSTGRIDFAGLAREPGELEAYVAWLSRVSPVSDPGKFPTAGLAMAYWINAYNALAMYNAVRSGLPPDLHKVRVRFFYRDRFLLGGSYISLYDLENKVIRPLGDPRVHSALNCMARGCPRLPREPFQADMLDAELEATTQYFFNEERNVQLDPARKVIRVSQILEFYREDFLEKAPSLHAFISKYRSSPVPADWKVEFIPYDWRLNSQ